MNSFLPTKTTVVVREKGDFFNLLSTSFMVLKLVTLIAVSAAILVGVGTLAFSEDALPGQASSQIELSTPTIAVQKTPSPPLSRATAPPPSTQVVLMPSLEISSPISPRAEVRTESELVVMGNGDKLVYDERSRTARLTEKDGNEHAYREVYRAEILRRSSVPEGFVKIGVVSKGRDANGRASEIVFFGKPAEEVEIIRLEGEQMFFYDEATRSGALLDEENKVRQYSDVVFAPSLTEDLMARGYVKVSVFSGVGSIGSGGQVTWVERIILGRPAGVI